MSGAILFAAMTAFPPAAHPASDEPEIELAVPAHPAAPVAEGPWLVPASHDPAEPRWGLAKGIQLGLWPSGGGPRGLIRVYTPYLENPPGMVINYLAIEPGRGKVRGFSELEASGLDDTQGKRIWSADTLEAGITPRLPWEPAEGETAKVRVAHKLLRAKELLVWFFVEPFEGGQRIAVQAVFRKDRPHEVALCVHALPRSSPFDACILTATMGNYARLRRLHLAGADVTAGQLWPAYREAHFTPHAEFPLARS